jgi:tetratricopeptide (TPR) repeat protein
MILKVAWRPAAFTFFVCLSCAVTLRADVIYLNNGSLMVVEKAWEEGGEIKYRTSRGVRSLPKSDVLRIKEEQSTASAPSQKWGIAEQNRPAVQAGPAAIPSAPVSGGAAVSKEALARLRDNLNADPSDAAAKAELVHALNSAASLQISQGDFPSAQSSLEEALRLDRRNATLLSNLGLIHLRLGNYQQAEDVLLASLESDRKNQWTYYLLGETCYEQEKISQAIAHWNDGLQLGPNEVISSRLQKARREAGVHKDLGALQSTHFILRYDRSVSDTQLGRQILAALEGEYRRLNRELTSQSPGTIAVILYPDQTYFDVTRAPGWSGALFDGKIRIPTRGLSTVTEELKATLAHELTHSFLDALPGRGSPTWFVEGVAQLQEGRTAATDKKALASLQRQKQLPPLKDLRGSFMQLTPEAADVAYAEGLSAVEYLVTRFGRSAIRSLVDLLAQNYNFENAFKTALGSSVSEFEAAWERDLARN